TNLPGTADVWYLAQTIYVLRHCLDPFGARGGEGPSCHSQSLLRCANFLLQNCAIQRNATKIGGVLSPLKNTQCDAAKNCANPSSLNYKSATLLASVTGCRITQLPAGQQGLFTFRGSG